MRRPAGFTYIGLLILLAVIGLAAAATVQAGSIAQRRQAEDELIFVGLQFKKALRAYYESTPAGSAMTAPRKLEDLLRDPRYPFTRRYLRKLYDDPLTGSSDWGIIRSGDGGIVGVYSESLDKPIRMANFPDELFYFEGKKSYHDWVFVYGVVCQNSGCELPPQNAFGP
ncbi:type II secretion system protein [Uliginosibacterium sp. sgz301328]|uniref:type II secretion system protein n=1 Tax=Uliginosibacterium sp. sgz301328 TaxID=3243764 RepID=UPI00359CF9D8